MTETTVQGTHFVLDGQPTYAGCAGVEGLLFNVRTVNATLPDPDQRGVRRGLF